MVVGLPHGKMRRSDLRGRSRMNAKRKNRSALALILILMVIGAALGLVACGGADQKAALAAALDKVEASMAKFQTMGANSTVADVKAARDEIAPLWAAVVAAAKNVKGADAAAAEKAWADLDAAVNSIPADAPIMQAATTIMGPVQALIAIEGNLRKLAPTEKK
jgi:cell division protein FtsB